jgi:hypothetical protein
MSEREATAWLDPIAACFGADRIGVPVSAHLTNCLRTLRMLYVFADRGVRLGPESAPVTFHHREAVKTHIAAALDAIIRR